jgi:hypothetical protein
MQMYYIEYPEGVAIGLWKNGDGNQQHIDGMGIEHLQASIRRIEKDIDYLQRSGRNESIINALVPLSIRKKIELQKALEVKRYKR